MLSVVTKESSERAAIRILALTRAFGQRMGFVRVGGGAVRLGRG